MAGIIGIGPKNNTMATRKLYKESKAILMYMEPVPEKVASGLKNNDTKHMVSVIERFIKENSGEYKKKGLSGQSSPIQWR